MTSSTVYRKVSPAFWTGETGRALVEAGPEAVAVALYLVTSPHSNPEGLYYLPMAYLCHDLGMPSEGASKALQRVCDTGFCSYDGASAWVFVPRMAAWQIGDTLKVNDKQAAGVQKRYETLPKNPFLGEFFDLYSEAFHLKERRSGQAPSKPLASPSEARNRNRSRNRSRSSTEEEWSEPSPAATASDPPSPPVITIPTNKSGEEYPVTQEQVDEWSELYPAVDVMQSLRNMRGWAVANQPRRKTWGGMVRFITNWLAKDQNGGGSGPPARGGPRLAYPSNSASAEEAKRRNRERIEQQRTAGHG